MKTKMKNLRRWQVVAPAAVGLLGGLGGWLLYRLVGCASGACPITSSPYLSVLFGALIGATLGSGLTGPAREEEKNDG